MLGRVDDMVVSGGVNVPAAAVAARLREHPAVAAAEVVGVPDEEWGDRVVAVLSVVETLSLDDARAWVADRTRGLGAARSWSSSRQLPLLPNGKVDRLAVRSLATEADE